MCKCVCVCAYVYVHKHTCAVGWKLLFFFFFFLIEEKSIFALIGFGNLDSEGKLGLICELDWLLIMTLLVQI